MYFLSTMKLDYIIVGAGLAGLAFAEELIEAGKSFVVFEDNSQNSSLVAGGVYNSVILKRYTPVWNAKEQLDIALPFYKKIEKKLAIAIDQKFCTKKVFKSIEDQNNWFTAADKPKLKELLDVKLDINNYKGLIANYKLGNVRNTGRIDTKKLIAVYKKYLSDIGSLYSENFEYNALIFEENTLKYKNIRTTKIVFCEGYGVKQNPFFNYLPLNEVKGETITIFAPNLNIDFLLKSTLFVLPLGENRYKVGATFNWDDKTNITTQEGREELLLKLNKIIKSPFKILQQEAGIRPTVIDRRPLVGVHEQFKSLAILNGLGTRGVMIAPLMAKQLFCYLEKKTPLNSEVDIKRFKNYFPV